MFEDIGVGDSEVEHVTRVEDHHPAVQNGRVDSIGHLYGLLGVRVPDLVAVSGQHGSDGAPARYVDLLTLLAHGGVEGGHHHHGPVKLALGHDVVDESPEAVLDGLLQ